MFASNQTVFEAMSRSSASSASARSGPGTNVTIGWFSVARACVMMNHGRSRLKTGRARQRRSSSDIHSVTSIHFPKTGW
jgi:hypothetical protein